MSEWHGGRPGFSRRRALRAGLGLTLAAPSLSRLGEGKASANSTQTAEELLQELDARIESGMAKHHIPGVAIGVFYQGQEYVRGYGVTNVDEPTPVDGNTLFRIASTTKTFTGTTVMRLVDQGVLDLDAPVRDYLPAFRVENEEASARVTLRQCLNHSAGWVGDDEQDFGRGDDALAEYVASMQVLPQLTPPGTQFGYNNTALDVAGRVIEVVTGQSYEEAVRELLLDPLGLERTRFFTDELAGYPIAGSHLVTDDRAVFAPDLWPLPRNGHPDGGLISSAQEQLRYARFHLGDGRAADGTALLSPASLQAMRSNPGPGGTLVAEIDGAGVSFFLRRTAEGVTVVQHGGSWAGQYSGFFLVPERDFAMTVLTNSEGGAQLRMELVYDDWVLERFAGLHNPPASPRRLDPFRLAAYEGAYLNRALDVAGNWLDTVLTLSADNGILRGDLNVGGTASPIALTFYRDDYVLVDHGHSEPSGSFRANFVRGSDDQVAWLSYGGRLYARQQV